MKLTENKVCLINMFIISIIGIVILNFPYDFEIVGGRLIRFMINPSQPFSPWNQSYNLFSYLITLIIFPISFYLTKLLIRLRIKSPTRGFLIGGGFGLFGAAIILLALTVSLGGFRRDIPFLVGGTTGFLLFIGFMLAAVNGAIICALMRDKRIVFSRK